MARFEDTATAHPYPDCWHDRTHQWNEDIVGRRTAAMAAAVSAALMGLTACGGSGSAAPDDAEKASSEGDQPARSEGDRLAGFVAQVEDMGIVEWSGQLLTRSPDDGGEQIFELSGRFSGSTGYSEVTMDSRIDGTTQLVDYLVVAGRTYFNSEAWGPGASDCWADITGDPARTWALPTQLDPTWPVSDAEATGLDGDEVQVTIPAKVVITGMPRGLFPRVPAGLKGVTADGVVIPHGPLLEVGVDVVGMWADVPPAELADIDTVRAGWWTMTMTESQDGTSVQPPKHVFDPAVTPPSQCMRA